MEPYVPVLFQKIAKYRPRIVCVNGKCIWDVIEPRIRKDLALSREVGNVENPGTGGSGGARLKQGKSSKSGTKWGLQPYRFVWGDALRDSKDTVKTESKGGSLYVTLTLEVPF